MKKSLIIKVWSSEFKQIMTGKKTEVYRLYNSYWGTKMAQQYDEVGFELDCPEEDSVTFRWTGYVIKTITDPRFGDAPVKVYAIQINGACLL